MEDNTKDFQRILKKYNRKSRIRSILYFTGWILFLVLLGVLPTGILKYVVVLVLALALLVPKILEYQGRKKELPTDEQKIIEEWNKNAEKEENEAMSRIKYGEKCLMAQIGGRWNYQVIRGTSAYYFRLISTDFKKFAPVLENYLEEDSYLSGNRKEFIIPFQKISEIRYWVIGDEERKRQREMGQRFLSYGRIQLYCDGKKKNIFLLVSSEEEQIRQFFSPVGTFITVLEKDRFAGKHTSEYDRRITEELYKEEFQRLPFLKKFVLIITILSVLVSLAYAFLDVPYKMTGAVCILLPLITYIFYLMNHHVLQMRDLAKGESAFGKKRASILLALFIPPLILILRGIIDINYTNASQIWLPFLLIMGFILVSFFVVSDEYKEHKSAIFVVICFASIYAIGTTMIGNAIFATKKAEYHESRVENLRIGESDRGENYYITIRLSDGGQKELGTYEYFYDNTFVGDVVIVWEREGAFGIDFAGVTK